MTYLDVYQISASNHSKYATAEDFCKLFTGDPNRLYLLALLLTANHEKAEQCFVDDLEDSAARNTGLREWAPSSVRRVIVHNAIRLIAPRTGQAHMSECAYQSAEKHDVLEMSVQDIPLASILRLNDFERFVHVLSVIERFSDRECVGLLGISCEEMRETRALAVQHVSGFERAIALIIDHPCTRNS